MTRFIETLTEVATPDPDTRRRGRILITISLGIIAVLLTVGLGLTLLQPTPGRFVNLGLAVLVFASAAALARQGFVTAGAYISCSAPSAH